MRHLARRLRAVPVRARLAGVLAVLVASALLSAVGQRPAYGDAHAPPPFPSSCDNAQSETYPGPQYPPPGYPSPPPTAATPFLYNGHLYSGPIPYEVPFKAIINGGEIDLPPNVVIPNIYASLCGWVQLPQLSGVIQPSTINIATPNVYVAGLEALPANVSFGTLQSTIDPTPAHNGGLDITLSGSTTQSVSTLDMTCGLTLNALFTTKSDGSLSGQPVTGPTMQGQAESVSNSFAVPAVQESNSCPPSIAQTFNNLLGLPAPAGLGTFKTPFCFDFELEGFNNPASTKPAGSPCSWPSS